MAETSLFDAPLNPVDEEKPAPAKPRRSHHKAKPMKVDRGGDADLDTQLRESVPDTYDPGYEGHKLRVAGLPWAEVAKRIGSASPASAVSVVSRYLQDAAKAQSASQMQEALQTQIDRYETIVRHWWPQATGGLDEKAATVVLRALERLDRVLRITDSDVGVSRETLVISGDPDAYIRQLKGVVEAREAKVIDAQT